MLFRSREAAAQAEADAEAAAAERASRAAERHESSSPSSSSSPSVSDSELTVPTPIVNPNEITQPVPSPVDPQSGSERPRSASPSAPWPSDEAETAMIPKISDAPGQSGAADETAVLPPVRDEGRDTGRRNPARDADPADRVPRGIFRDERPAASAPEGENERTRELPQITDPQANPPADRQGPSGRSGRPRPDWAEETPLDDLPTLADELLGDHDDEDPGPRGRGRRPRR